MTSKALSAHGKPISRLTGFSAPASWTNIQRLGFFFAARFVGAAFPNNSICS
jgi:hypothetical protein